MADSATAYSEKPAGKGSGNPIEVSAPMVGLTWLTFGLLALILYKVAWKPVLSALDRREKEIRDALEQARITREEYARLEERRKQLIEEADNKARQIIDDARHAAVEAARTIEARAREEASILLANAQRDIRIEREKAIADLRREAADLAVGLARKVLEDQLDESRARSLVDRMIQRL
ncbi:MAG: F0F1 ATP synthase subunit B [Kiritimatiellae bacterium]|nr:F0F1 ATP synthase subunit B [Kiritimatiellia bacterium]MDW8459304.1 F0F1 ATP synthase subunit B [Verrucomicrobiota bacterium]